MKRIVNALDKLNWRKRAYAVSVLCVTMAVTLPAQTYTRLFSFSGMGGYGSIPEAGLVQGTDGNFYGTTGTGGAYGLGTVFKIPPGGLDLTTLYSFCPQSGCTDGRQPLVGLVQGTDGNFYGTMETGGANDSCSGQGCGTVFKITPSGTLTTLYDFCSQSGCTDGATPQAALIQATNGDLYGSAVGGGAYGYGTVFRITSSGTLTTLYSFCAQSGCPDGQFPYGALVQATNGDFYGTTLMGGGNDNCGTEGTGCGTVFKITPSGTLTTLYRFCAQSGCPDGRSPNGGLVQATNGDLYGTTYEGGTNCVQATPLGCGTVFKITPSGTLTTLYMFCPQSDCSDGADPVAGLIQATDGNLYGTTLLFGSIGQGTVFKITPSGTLSTVYNFCLQSDCSDGASPGAALVQGTDGTFYGTTYHGGGYGEGAVFSLSVGLGPFVETRPTSGKVGKIVEILGTNLTGATSVSFNGTAAVYRVVSSSLIATKVPAGAINGKVQVVTPSGTISSNVAFRVLP